LAVRALRGDREALKALLDRVAGAAESARERVASAMEALRELDSLLAEGAEKLPEAKAHVRVASSRLQVASESLLELAAALGAALALSELSERDAPPAQTSQGGGGS
jgi:chromosome segregation ATPase